MSQLVRPLQLLSMTLALSLMSMTSLTLSAGEFNHVISIGDPMPTFKQLPTIADTTLSSADIEEDVVVLVSMSNNCPFSTGIEDDLIAFADSVKNQSVKIVAMGFNLHKNDLMPAMKKRAEEKGFNFTYLRDDSQKLGRALGTAVTPEFFVFNKARQLVYMGKMHNSPPMEQSGEKFYTNGKPTEFYVADAVKHTLKNKTVKITETAPLGCTVEYKVDRYEK